MEKISFRDCRCKQGFLISVFVFSNHLFVYSLHQGKNLVAWHWFFYRNISKRSFFLSESAYCGLRFIVMWGPSVSFPKKNRIKNLEWTHTHIIDKTNKELDVCAFLWALTITVRPLHSSLSRFLMAPSDKKTANMLWDSVLFVISFARTQKHTCRWNCEKGT